LKSDPKKSQTVNPITSQTHSIPRRKISRFYNRAAIVRQSGSLFTEKKPIQKFDSVHIKIKKSQFYKTFKKLKFQVYRNQLVKILWEANTAKLVNNSSKWAAISSIHKTRNTLESLNLAKKHIKYQHLNWPNQSKRVEKVEQVESTPTVKKVKTITPFVLMQRLKKRITFFKWKMHSHARRKVKRDATKLLNQLLYSTYNRLTPTLSVNYFKYYANIYSKLNLLPQSKHLLTKQLVLKSMLRGPLFLKNLPLYHNSSLHSNSWWATALFASNKTLKNFTLLMQAVKKTTNKMLIRRLPRFNGPWAAPIDKTHAGVLPNYNPRKISTSGYAWTKTTQPLSFSEFTNTLTYNQFWESLENTKGVFGRDLIKSFIHSSYNFEWLFCVNQINQTLHTVRLLNQLNNSYFFTTYWKTLLLNETLTQHLVVPTSLTSRMRDLAQVNPLTFSTGLSYYGLNFNVLKKQTYQSAGLTSGVGSKQQYFYKYLQLFDTKKALLVTNQALVLPFKNSYQHTKIHLSLIQDQLAINRISSLAAYDRVIGKLKLKPTVFTYKWWTHHFRSHEILIARANSRYYYWNTGEESNTLHVNNMLAQTPFVLNWIWNENDWENSLHIRTSDAINNPHTPLTVDSGAYVTNKVVNLLLSHNYTGVDNQDIATELVGKQTKW